VAVREVDGLLYDDHGDWVGALLRAHPSPDAMASAELVGLNSVNGTDFELDRQKWHGQSAFLEQTEQILGARFLYSGRDEGQDDLRVIVLDLSGADTEVLSGLRERYAATSSVRVERASAAQLARWERLRGELEALRRREPPAMGMLRPRARCEPPPVEVRLTESGRAIAIDLEQRYGEMVDLRVGALPFKDGIFHRPSPDLFRDEGRQLVDPSELTLRLAGPLAVPAGQGAVHQVLVINHGNQTLTFRSGDYIIPHIINAEGRIVGGYTGPQAASAIEYTAKPGKKTDAWIRVGTTSFDPDLGPTLPPGPWRLVLPLDIHRDKTSQQLSSPPLDFTITS
jgi:hypothetical protein